MSTGLASIFASALRASARLASALLLFAAMLDLFDAAGGTLKYTLFERSFLARLFKGYFAFGAAVALRSAVDLAVR